MKKTLAALAALALVALGVTIAPTAAFAASGAVTVTITDQASAPITGAFVQLLQSNGSITIQETGTPGTYSLTGVAPGSSYKVSATATGYATEYYGDTSVKANASPVVVTDSATTSLAMVMVPESTIQGTVTDHLGQPVSTHVLLYSSNEGWGIAGQVSTDPSNGSYAFAGLGHGDYKILVYTSGSPADATQWYVDANTIDAATVIHLTGASATADVQLEQAAKITGAVTNTIGHPLRSIVVGAIPAGAADFFNAGSTDANGAYTIQGLLPGAYTLQASDNSHFFATQTADAATTVAIAGTEDFVLVPNLPSEAQLQITGIPVTPVSGPTQVTAGQSYTWVVTDDNPSDVYAAIYSEPVYLGAFAHDAGGTTAAITVTIPADTTAGSHSISYLSYDSGNQVPENDQFYFPIQVAAAPTATLAETGTDGALPLGLGILLLLAGGGAVWIARRRVSAR